MFNSLLCTCTEGSTTNPMTGSGKVGLGGDASTEVYVHCTHQNATVQSGPEVWRSSGSVKCTGWSYGYANKYMYSNCHNWSAYDHYIDVKYIKCKKN